MINNNETDTAYDMLNRMVPTEADIATAEKLRAETGAEMALTPIVFPGKEHGFWTAGQAVECPGGAVVCDNDDSFYDALKATQNCGQRILGDREGTVGYVVHDEGGWAVFESLSR